MKTNKTTMHEISLQLDERNLAHVFSALALAAIADEKMPCEASRCWWTEDAFCLRLPQTQEELFNDAHQFVKTLKWTEGIGCDEKRKIKSSPHHGFFSASGGHCGNPLVSYHDQGMTPSVFKTFSGQKGPSDILGKQKDAIDEPATAKPDWISQRAPGVASWKFDARTGGHAYSQGFSANDDGSGDQSPFYPAIELLSIAGAAFLFAPQAWLRDKDTLCYSVWRTELMLSLAPFASTGLLDGVAGRTYSLSTSGNAYGKGAAYRHFTEATPLQPRHRRSIS
jgi:hypothetical protein